MHAVGCLLSTVLLLFWTGRGAAKNPEVAPDVSITSPSDGSATNAGSVEVEVSFSAKDGGKGNVKTVILRANGTEVGRFENPPQNKTGVTKFMVNLSSFAEGTIQLQAEAYQGAVQAGLVGQSAVVNLVLDRTPPALTHTLTPAPNASGWNNSDVTVHFTATDSGSGIASVTPDIIVTTEGANQNFTGIATDHAGNTASVNVTVNLDKTSPRAGLSLAGGQVLNTTTPTLAAAVSDALSGVDFALTTLKVDGNAVAATVANGQLSFTPSTPLTTDFHVLGVVVTDLAGNETTAETLFSVEPVVIMADADGDGLDDAWEAQFSMSTNAFAFGNLVGWWKKDGLSLGRLPDRSVNNIEGTLSSFPPSPFVTGLFSNGLYFTQSDAQVELDATNNVLNLGSFTISTWLLGSAPPQETPLVQWTASDGSFWQLGANSSGQAQLIFNSPGETQLVLGGNNALTTSDGSWHHLAGTYDLGTSNAVLYVDGSVEESLTLTNWSPSTVASLTFGRSASSDLHAPFILDETRLYNISISSNDIVNLPNTFSDPDGDGLVNRDEFLRGAHPNQADTDGDGLNDGGDAFPTDYYNGVLPSLVMISGNHQAGALDTFLPEPLVVEITSGGVGLSNAPLTFAVSQGDGTLAAVSNPGLLLSTLNLRTDTQGRVPGFFKLSTSPGTNLVTVSAVSLAGTTSVQFTAIAIEEAAPVLTIVSGDDQVGEPDALLPEALAVRLTDTGGAVLTNMLVSFSVMEGGGFLTTNTASGEFVATASVASDVAGLAHIFYHSPATLGATSRVDAVAIFGTNEARVTFTERTTPSLTSGRVGAGLNHSLVVHPDGTVLAWGQNHRGQLGIGQAGSADNPPSGAMRYPVRLLGVSNVVEVAGGITHSLAVGFDGALWVWGDNDYSQLGDGTNSQRDAPVRVIGLDGVRSAAGSQYHSLAVKQDGTVWAWGINGGRLGDGGTASTNQPVQTVGLTDVVAVAAGVHHSMAFTAIP